MLKYTLTILQLSPHEVINFSHKPLCGNIIHKKCLYQTDADFLKYPQCIIKEQGQSWKIIVLPELKFTENVLLPRIWFQLKSKVAMRIFHSKRFVDWNTFYPLLPFMEKQGNYHCSFLFIFVQEQLSP